MGKSIVRALGAITTVIQATSDFAGYLFFAVVIIMLLVPVFIEALVMLGGPLFG